MKKLAIIIGIAIVLAATVVLWAQRDPDETHTPSRFYGHIYYMTAGCECRNDDEVIIENTLTHDRVEVGVSCSANGIGVWSSERVFYAGQYDIWGKFADAYSGCDSTETKRVLHSDGPGSDQQVDLHAY